MNELKDDCLFTELTTEESESVQGACHYGSYYYYSPRVYRRPVYYSYGYGYGSYGSSGYPVQNISIVVPSGYRVRRH